LAHGGSAIPPWCRHRVGTVYSFLNIDICRCLNATTSCKIKKVSYSLTTTLIERKLEMNVSELKKNLLEFVAYLEKIAIIHDEHCHVVEHKKTRDYSMKNSGKISDAGSRSFGHNSGGSSYGGASNKASDRDRTKSRHGTWSDSTCTGKQSAREPPSCLNTKKCAGEKHHLSNCPHTGKDEAIALLPEYKKKRDADKKKATSKLWAKTERRLRTEIARPRNSRRRIMESRSRYW
jgi:hypothetical protein